MKITGIADNSHNCFYLIYNDIKKGAKAFCLKETVMKKPLSIKENKKVVGGDAIDDLVDREYQPLIDEAHRKQNWKELGRLLDEKATKKLKLRGFKV